MTQCVQYIAGGIYGCFLKPLEWFWSSVKFGNQWLRLSSVVSASMFNSKQGKNGIFFKHKKYLVSWQNFYFIKKMFFFNFFKIAFPALLLMRVSDGWGSQKHLWAGFGRSRRYSDEIRLAGHRGGSRMCDFEISSVWNQFSESWILSNI